MAAGRTIIVGLGITGTSCVRHFVRNDAGTDLLVVDTRRDPPGFSAFRAEFPDVEVLTGVRSLDFDGVVRLVVSPGVALTDPLLSGRPEAVELVSDIDIFCQASTVPVIAVTGTNGKSTVTSLVGHLLRESGIAAVVGGNLGEAALDLLAQPAEVYVLELSSFQLERLDTQHFKAATILNVSEDHLDRHGDMAAYVAAKQRIYRDCELAVAHRGEAETFPVSACATITFGADEPGEHSWGVREQNGVRWLACGKDAAVASGSLPLAGVHNELNVLAAMALASAFDLSPAQLGRAVCSFSGLAHRCQRVAVVAGVAYVNDSKATNVGATVAALIGLGDIAPNGVPKIVLIAGGDGKGANFEPLAGVVGRFAKALILLGRDAPKMAEVLGHSVATHRVENMEAAVRMAASLAEPGDLVLLSPACASLDMYRNFAARGDHFARAVAELAA